MNMFCALDCRICVLFCDVHPLFSGCFFFLLFCSSVLLLLLYLFLFDLVFATKLSFEQPNSSVLSIRLSHSRFFLSIIYLCIDTQTHSQFIYVFSNIYGFTCVLLHEMGLRIECLCPAVDTVLGAFRPITFMLE